MLEDLKNEVFQANINLVKYNLVVLTWGNVSERYEDYIVIKPSGVKYSTLKPEDMVVVNINGDIIEGNYRPSSDVQTHIELYKSFPYIKGIAHTHSDYATSFAQAGMDIVCFGTTHADYFFNSIPCTRLLTERETKYNYEKNTGKVIVETFKDKDYLSCPGVLVNSHGVFSWGNTAEDAVYNAVVIEKVAKMNLKTLLLNPKKQPICDYTLEKHYKRKHGENAYYGQQ